MEAAASLQVLDSGLVSQLVPERQEVATALVLFGMVVTEASAFKDGRLLVEFDKGTTRLTVMPDPVFEAWNVAGPNNLRVVCLPEGDLAIWR